MANILIIDDEKAIRRSLREIVEFEEHQVEEAEDGKQGLKLLTSKPFDAVFCDIKMPNMDGLELLKELGERDILTPLIMISGHGNIETAVEAIKNGAFDFVEKPLDLNRIMVALRNALERKTLEEETKMLKQKVNRVRPSNIIGNSQALLEVLEMVDKVAPTDARVLITGPNGTGKELIAKQIHDKSNRAKRPFIEVNCAAIPSELIESELFGHEKGAFTSAIKTKKGRFEQANGGTLFLDEIGDMSASAQAKVLRALQENKITRVGGETDIKVNVRVLAATNKDLRAEISANHFREDLYHRLSVILLQLPALNERRDDIPLLIEYFNKLICADYGIAIIELEKKAIELLQAYDWTGNIRELRNVVERLIILSPNKITAAAVEKYVLPK